MSYDDETLGAMEAYAAGFLHLAPEEARRARQLAKGITKHAIPPLTLKTEDGRFVKVEPYRIGHKQFAVPEVYRIVPEDQP